MGPINEKVMTPSILRMTLAVALILGVGVVMNILGSQERNAHKRVAMQRQVAPIPTARVPVPKQANRAAEARRVANSVRGHLEDRGYLARSAETLPQMALPAAILAFEFDHNLTLTAMPNAKLLEKMIFAQAPSDRQHPVNPTTQVARKLIGEVQRALNHLGYGEPNITMALDAKTRNAIRKFERARGLQVSGRISAPLINSLGPAFNASKVISAAQPDENAPTLTASNVSERN